MLFNKDFYKQKFYTQSENIMAYAKLLKNKEYQLTFVTEGSEWTEDTNTIDFKRWTEIVDQNLKQGSYKPTINLVNEKDYKNILNEENAKECYGYITNFEGEFGEELNESYLTIKNLIENLINQSLELEEESVHKARESQKVMSIENKYINFVSKKMEKEGLIEQLKSNEIMPIRVSSDYDLCAYVSKTDITLNNETLEYNNSNLNFKKPLDLSDKYFMEFFLNNKNLLKDLNEKEITFGNIVKIREIEKNEELCIEF